MPKERKKREIPITRTYLGQMSQEHAVGIVVANLMGLPTPKEDSNPLPADTPVVTIYPDGRREEISRE